MRAWAAVVVASKGLGMTKGVDGAGCFGLRCFGVVRKARAGGRVPRRSAGNGIDPRAVGGRDGYVSLRQSFPLFAPPADSTFALPAFSVRRAFWQGWRRVPEFGVIIPPRGSLSRNGVVGVWVPELCLAGFGRGWFNVAGIL